MGSESSTLEPQNLERSDANKKVIEKKFRSQLGSILSELEQFDILIADRQQMLHPSTDTIIQKWSERSPLLIDYLLGGNQKQLVNNDVFNSGTKMSKDSSINQQQLLALSQKHIPNRIEQESEQLRRQRRMRELQESQSIGGCCSCFGNSEQSQIQVDQERNARWIILLIDTLKLNTNGKWVYLMQDAVNRGHVNTTKLGRQKLLNQLQNQINEINLQEEFQNPNKPTTNNNSSQVSKKDTDSPVKPLRLGQQDVQNQKLTRQQPNTTSNSNQIKPTTSKFQQATSSTRLAQTNFTSVLVAIKDQVDQEGHPLKFIIDSFQLAFSQVNKHLLYTEKCRERLYKRNDDVDGQNGQESERNDQDDIHGSLPSKHSESKQLFKDQLDSGLLDTRKQQQQSVKSSLSPSHCDNISEPLPIHYAHSNSVIPTLDKKREREELATAQHDIATNSMIDDLGGSLHASEQTDEDIKTAQLNQIVKQRTDMAPSQEQENADDDDDQELVANSHEGQDQKSTQAGAVDDARFGRNQSESDSREHNNQSTSFVGVGGVDLDFYGQEKVRLILEIKIFVAVLMETIIEFFELHQMVKKRVNRDQLENFVTSQVLSGPVYVLLFCTLALYNSDQLQKLDIILKNANVNLASLQVKDVFRLSEALALVKPTTKATTGDSQKVGESQKQKKDFSQQKQQREDDKNVEDKFQEVEKIPVQNIGTNLEETPEREQNNELEPPYRNTICDLKNLFWEQSPIAKVELIYNALKFRLAEEVDDFWGAQEGYNGGSQRNLDIDNLQGISIYLVWSLKDPSILIDCLITQEFLTKSAKLSTRSLFLKVLEAAIDFLLEIQLDENPQENDQSNQYGPNMTQHHQIGDVTVSYEFQKHEKNTQNGQNSPNIPKLDLNQLQNNQQDQNDNKGQTTHINQSSARIQKDVQNMHQSDEIKFLSDRKEQETAANIMSTTNFSQLNRRSTVSNKQSDRLQNPSPLQPIMMSQQQSITTNKQPQDTIDEDNQSVVHFGASHSAMGLGNSTEKIISVTPRNRISEAKSQFGGQQNNHNQQGNNNLSAKKKHHNGLVSARTMNQAQQQQDQKSNYESRRVLKEFERSVRGKTIFRRQYTSTDFSQQESLDPLQQQRMRSNEFETRGGVSQQNFAQSNLSRQLSSNQQAAFGSSGSTEFLRDSAQEEGNEEISMSRLSFGVPAEQSKAIHESKLVQNREKSDKSPFKLGKVVVNDEESTYKMNDLMKTPTKVLVEGDQNIDNKSTSNGKSNDIVGDNPMTFSPNPLLILSGGSKTYKTNQRYLLTDQTNIDEEDCEFGSDALEIENEEIFDQKLVSVMRSTNFDLQKQNLLNNRLSKSIYVKGSFGDKNLKKELMPQIGTNIPSTPLHQHSNIRYDPTNNSPLKELNTGQRTNQIARMTTVNLSLDNSAILATNRSRLVLGSNMRKSDGQFVLTDQNRYSNLGLATNQNNLQKEAKHYRNRTDLNLPQVKEMSNFGANFETLDKQKYENRYDQDQAVFGDLKAYTDKKWSNKLQDSSELQLEQDDENTLLRTSKDQSTLKDKGIKKVDSNQKMMWPINNSEIESSPEVVQSKERKQKQNSQKSQSFAKEQNLLSPSQNFQIPDRHGDESSVSNHSIQADDQKVLQNTAKLEQDQEISHDFIDDQDSSQLDQSAKKTYQQMLDSHNDKEGREIL